MDAKALKAKSAGPGYGCIAVVALVVFGACYLMMDLTSKSPESVADRRRVQMTVNCQEAVRSRLRAPSTASFSREAERVGVSTDTTFSMTGSVDSQNGFGAMLRGTYLCRAKKRRAKGDSTATWHWLEVGVF